MERYKTFNMGNNITCTINCNYRTAATLNTLETFIIMNSMKQSLNLVILEASIHKFSAFQ